MKDKYDKAVKYLTKRPGEIFDAWRGPDFHRAGCLFAPASKDGRFHGQIGCLTMIRADPHLYRAQTKRLTAAIIKDKSIPLEASEIKAADLPTFARWQRRIDKELGRV